MTELTESTRVSVLDGVDDAPLAPVNRARLARYLELPSVAELDETTDAEIRRLDERRHELLSVWRRAVVVPIERVNGRWIELRGDVTRVEATANYGRQLIDHGADALVVAAFTVGATVDELIKNHLARQEIYEAFVLKQWAATMTEQARVALTDNLKCRADTAGRSLLAYDGPGYNGWPLDALGPLLEMIDTTNERRGARPIRVTEHGVLLPTNSMLIVYGLTRRAAIADAVDRPETLGQCHRCAMRNCRYRTRAVIEVAC